MQKLLKAMPDVRQDYVRELDTALVESRTGSSHEDIKMLREQIEGAIKDLSRLFLLTPSMCLLDPTFMQ